jgi:hypothetical protein
LRGEEGRRREKKKGGTHGRNTKQRTKLNIHTLPLLHPILNMYLLILRLPFRILDGDIFPLVGF